jgi:regulatory protein
MDLAEPAMVLEKIRNYCGYQERCIRDVEEKLKDWAVQKKLIPGIIAQLQNESILNEERFARAYTRGKFRLNKWGRQKIEFELKIRGIPDAMIAEGLKEIDEEEYLQVLQDLIIVKHKDARPEKDLNIREKIINFAVGKGYEMDLVLDYLNKLKI